MCRIDRKKSRKATLWERHQDLLYMIYVVEMQETEVCLSGGGVRGVMNEGGG